MTNAEKKTLVNETAIAEYKNSNDVNKVAEKILTNHASDGITFSDALTLAKQIGREGGYVRTVKERRALADTLLRGYELKGDRDELVKTRDEITNKSGASVAYVQGIMRDKLEADGREWPKKTRGNGGLAGWRGAMARAIGLNVDITPDALYDAVRPHVKNDETCALYIKEFAPALILAVTVAKS